MKRATPIICAAVMGAMSLAGGSALGDVTLVDQNSSITIDTTGAGITNWLVDNKDYLKQHWFWYRAGAMTAAAKISDLPVFAAETLVDTNDDGQNDTLSVAYRSTAAGAKFTAYVWMSLAGSPAYSGGSSLAQIVTIVNDDATQPLSMQFYQYMDMDMAPPGGGETAGFAVDGPDMPVNTVSMVASDLSAFYQASVVSTPDGHDVSSNAGAITTLDRLTASYLNVSASNVLGTTPGPVTALDVAWAWGWNFNIAVNDSASVVMSGDLTPVYVPVPSSIWMGSVMLLAMGSGMVRRQRRR